MAVAGWSAIVMLVEVSAGGWTWTWALPLSGSWRDKPTDDSKLLQKGDSTLR